MTPHLCPENADSRPYSAHIREIARSIALDRASGKLHSLLDLLEDARPFELRDYLGAFYLIRDVTAAERSKLAAAGAPLSERLICALIAHQVEEAISEARRRLSRVARRGGQGVAPPGVSP